MLDDELSALSDSSTKGSAAGELVDPAPACCLERSAAVHGYEETLAVLEADRHEIQKHFADWTRQLEALHERHLRRQERFIAAYKSQPGAGAGSWTLSCSSGCRYPSCGPSVGGNAAPSASTAASPNCTSRATIRSEHIMPPTSPPVPEPVTPVASLGRSAVSWHCEELCSDFSPNNFDAGRAPLSSARRCVSTEEARMSPMTAVLPGAPQEPAEKPCPLPLDTGPRAGRRENVVADASRISTMLQPVDQSSKKVPNSELSTLITMSSHDGVGEQGAADSPSDGLPPPRRRHLSKRNSRMMSMSEEPLVSTYQETLRSIVNHTAFSGLSLFVILLNAVFIGVQTNIVITSGLEAYQGNEALRDLTAYLWVENCFCLFFFVELLLRFMASPRYFLFGIDWRWHLFDGLLVGTCIIDVVMCAAEVSYNAGVQYVRILRIVRMARILRIIRVLRFFRSLRIMVHSIINSMAELLWVFVLLFFFIYVTSIVLASAVTQYFRDLSTPITHLNDSQQVLLTHLGSVPGITVELFSAISGGRDWTDLLGPLLEVHVVCGVVFLLYIVFVVFGVLNVVTGAFVDSIRVVSQRDNDLVIEEELKKVNTFKEEITDIFLDADCDGSDTLSWDEFEQHLKDERVRAYFASLELDISEAEALFRLLDLDETDEIPIDRFVSGCLRMRGDAKGIDVNMILYENEKMLLKLTQFTDYAEDQFERLMRAIQACRRGIGQLTCNGIELEGQDTWQQQQQQQQHGRSGRRSSKQWLDERRHSIVEERRRSVISSEIQATLKQNHTNTHSVAPAPVGSPVLNRGKSLGRGRLEAALNVISVCDH